jgi:N-methylhydantoinase B/oxoprolinase/acetone carboxylase alpha subunit
LRKTIHSIPDGVYAFEDFMDSDGLTDDPVKIAIRISIEGDQAILDFSPSSAQVEGGVNANFAVTCSAILYVFRCLVKEDIPFNTGLMRPLRITAPKGSVVNAQHPAATAGGNVETSQRIVDVILGALSKAIPESIPAASSGTMNNVAFGGYDPEKKSRFTYYETIGGGMGGSPEREGMSGVHTHMTNSLNTPLEALENYLPMRIKRYGLRKSSGGLGKHKGGEGIIREFQFFVPTQVSILSERRKFAPYGVLGGEEGKTGKNLLITPKGQKKHLGSKVNLKVQPGDILRIETPGGGGYGKKR